MKHLTQAAELNEPFQDDASPILTPNGTKFNFEEAIKHEEGIEAAKANDITPITPQETN